MGRRMRRVERGIMVVGLLVDVSKLRVVSSE